MMERDTRTPSQVNTTSRCKVSWSKAPNGPRRPNNFSNSKPVATGGITSGNEMIVSTTDLPGQSRRASSSPAARPNGRITTVLSAETQAVNQTICQSSADIAAIYGR